MLTRTPADPRYELPYSGAYWQARAPGALLRSRSLWDTEMPVTAERHVAGTPADLSPGPSHQSLLLVSRRLVLASSDTPVDVLCRWTGPNCAPRAAASTACWCGR